MKRIKLVEIHAKVEYDNYGDCYESRVLGAGISDWEEVSDEDFEFIRNNLPLMSTQRKSTVVIVEQHDNVVEFIKDIKSTLNKLRKKEEERLAVEQKRREEAAEKQAMKKLERDRKALAKLVENNPDLIKDIIKT